jgi:hypothetical protein
LPSAGGEREFISIPPLPTIIKNVLIPLLWIDRPTLFIYFTVPTYLPTLELVSMNRKPLPYPPQMRNADHLPSSPVILAAIFLKKFDEIIDRLDGMQTKIAAVQDEFTPLLAILLTTTKITTNTTTTITRIRRRQRLQRLRRIRRIRRRLQQL